MAVFAFNVFRQQMTRTEGNAEQLTEQLMEQLMEFNKGFVYSRKNGETYASKEEIILATDQKHTHETHDSVVKPDQNILH